MNDLSKKVAIVGVGEADHRRVPGRTSFHFQAQAVKRALDDAGLDKSAIDGLLTAYTLVEPYPFYSAALSEYLGIRPKVHASLTIGGATPTILVEHAAAAIVTGQCNTALVTWGDNRQSGVARDSFIAATVSSAGHPDFENPYGPLVAAMYALAAQRHMHEYGTTPEQLAQVAVTCRQHASLHPDAIMREPLTVQDVLKSKMIASPLHMLDCCLVSDFGGAAILTSAERAKDFPKAPVYLLGAGEGFTHEFISQAPDLTTSGAKQAGENAYRTAGLGPQDMDFAELYDCFTITVITLLEDLGFCGRGEAGPFVEEGNVALGGKLPINTHGGLLSYCNGGILHIVEAVRQLRGEAGPRQVPNARVGLVHNQGGVLSTHCALILGRD